MKKFISILILAFSFVIAVDGVAQEARCEREKDHKAMWEKFRQDKNDFFTQRMQLTDEQAKEFFPLYEEMEKKKFEISRQVRREACEILNSDNVTDEQYKAAADRAAALAEKEMAIEKEYYARFCQILSPKQQFLYHRCEIEFHKKVINKKQKGGVKGKDRK